REVGHLGTARLGHADNDGARKYRAKDGKHVVIDGFLCQALGDAGVALGVGGDGLDFFAENAARGVDFLDGQLDAVLEIGAGRGGAVGELGNGGNLDDVLWNS